MDTKIKKIKQRVREELMSVEGVSDLPDADAKGKIHKTVSDTLHMLRLRGEMHDYQVSIKFTDFLDRTAGFDAAIKIWFTSGGTTIPFTLHIKEERYDPIAAYDRAMKILGNG